MRKEKTSQTYTPRDRISEIFPINRSAEMERVAERFGFASAQNVEQIRYSID